MKKLFIIGNGFDIAHGLYTSYEDLGDFYVNNLYQMKKMIWYLPFRKHA